MDYVHTEQQGDAQARTLNRNLLVFTDFRGAFDIEKAADFSCGYALVDVDALAFTGYDGAGYRQVELAYLLFESHSGHELGDKAVHLLVG